METPSANGGDPTYADPGRGHAPNHPSPRDSFDYPNAYAGTDLECQVGRDAGCLLSRVYGAPTRCKRGSSHRRGGHLGKAQDKREKGKGKQLGFAQASPHPMPQILHATEHLQQQPKGSPVGVSPRIDGWRLEAARDPSETAEERDLGIQAERDRKSVV